MSLHRLKSVRFFLISGGWRVMTAYLAGNAVPATDVSPTSQDAWPKTAANVVLNAGLRTETCTECRESQTLVPPPVQLGAGVLTDTRYAVPGRGQLTTSALGEQDPSPEAPSWATSEARLWVRAAVCSALVTERVVVAWRSCAPARAEASATVRS